MSLTERVDGESPSPQDSRERPIILPRLIQFLRTYPVGLYVSSPAFRPPVESKWAEVATIFVGPLYPTTEIANLTRRLRDDLERAGLKPTFTTPDEKWNYPGIRPILIYDEDVDEEIESRQTTHEPLDPDFATRSRYRSDPEPRIKTSKNQRRTLLDIYPTQEEALAAYVQQSAKYKRKQVTAPLQSTEQELSRTQYTGDLVQVIQLILNAPTPRQRRELASQMIPPIAGLAVQEARHLLAVGLTELATRVDSRR